MVAGARGASSRASGRKCVCLAVVQCREEAGRTLGLLCLGQPHFPHVHAVLDSLLASGLLVEVRRTSARK